MRFFLIDRITQWETGTAAEAIKNVALSEDYFDDPMLDARRSALLNTWMQTS